MAWLAVFAFAIFRTEVLLYSQTSEAWHSELRGLMTGGMSSVTVNQCCALTADGVRRVSYAT
eukprot:462732-Pelagomonas_calceolata.AAC.1